MGASLAGLGVVLVPGVLAYAFTWLGIGRSLLRSGSVAPGGIAGASAA